MFSDFEVAMGHPIPSHPFPDLQVRLDAPHQIKPICLRLIFIHSTPIGFINQTVDGQYQAKGGDKYVYTYIYIYLLKTYHISIVHIVLQ